jgi:ketosteroid isomerase-like protein
MPAQLAAAAPLTDKDRAAIRAIITQFDKDMLARKIPDLVSVYTEDAILMPPHAPMVRGRAAIRQFLEDFPKVTEFKQKPVEIEGEGDLAYPWGTFEMAVLPAGAAAPVRDRGKVLGIFHRQPDGSWLASRVCWNSDLELTP